MATVAYTNAIILFRGYDQSGDFNETNLEYTAEMLDATTFGDNNRVRKAGLFMTRVTGRGWVQFGATAVGNILFDAVGTDDDVLFLAGNGVVEGQTTGQYAFKVTTANLNHGAKVGELLPFDVTFEARDPATGA